jgi:hypothetical protein
MGIRTGDSASPPNMPENAWIHHNLFRDFPDKPVPSDYGSGQTDALEWGQTNVRAWVPSFNSGLYFEYNMLLRHLQGGSIGAGSVDFKVGGVVARYNTFIDSPGRMDQRGPTGDGFTPGSVFESNYFDGVSRGMVIHGRAVELIGNEVNGGSITLRAGGSECDEKNPSGSYHSRTCSAFVAGNDSTLRVGIMAGPGTVLPSTGTVIEEHTGSISFSNHVNTTDNRSQSTSVNFVPAAALTESEVGPDAIVNATAAYKAARGL